MLVESLQAEGLTDLVLVFLELVALNDLFKVLRVEHFGEEVDGSHSLSIAVVLHGY